MIEIMKHNMSLWINMSTSLHQFYKMNTIHGISFKVIHRKGLSSLVDSECSNDK